MIYEPIASKTTWNKDHIVKLKDLVNQNLTYHQIAKQLTKLFGIERTEKSVQHKKLKLNIPTPPHMIKGGNFTRVKILEDGTIQQIESQRKGVRTISKKGNIYYKTKGKHPYTSLTLEQKQEYMNHNRKRLMEEKNFLGRFEKKMDGYCPIKF